MGAGGHTHKGTQGLPGPFTDEPPALLGAPLKLKLTRKPSNAQATLGEMTVDGFPFCETLEDPVRELGPNGEGKVYGQTAIPAGTYRVAINWSVKFQKKMIAVLDVPHFTGIRIHSGNDAGDTEGCILLGHTIDGPNAIHGGSFMLPLLFALVEDNLAAGETVTLEVV